MRFYGAVRNNKINKNGLTIYLPLGVARVRKQYFISRCELNAANNNRTKALTIVPRNLNSVLEAIRLPQKKANEKKISDVTSFSSNCDSSAGRIQVSKDLKRMLFLHLFIY